MEKFTKQKKAILSTLRETASHPTAEWIHQQTKKDIPSIGLATVYRNLKSLERSQLIQSIKTGDNKEHYDGDTSPHAHLYCTKCNSVTDIFLTQDQLDELAIIQRNDSFQLIYYGRCNACKIKTN